jgi:hypothetical protein
LIYCNAVETARQTLLCHLQHCIRGLIDQTHDQCVLGDISNGTQQRRKKRGSKINNKKGEHDQLVKMMVISLLLDSQYWALLGFDKDHNILFLRSSLVLFINARERLQLIMVRNQRKDLTLVEEMTSIIERQFKLQGTEITENMDSSDVVWEDKV